MKLIGAFFRLVRWPNLVFIALTQVLFYFCILVPAFTTDFAQFEYKLNPFYFSLICISSVLIAAGGYAINDYFDLNIDQINKPEKLVVEKHIRRRWAILWHLGLSFTGVILSTYVGWKINNLFLGFANLFCVALLWFYSTSFKKQLLIGNLIISLLTAWVVVVIWFCEIRLNNIPQGFTQVQSKLYKLVVLYASFAFIISLIREVVKDIEDMNGDEKYGCKTMPIVWGVNSSKLFAGTLLLILISVILIIEVYILQFKWWIPAIYCLLLILIPLLQITLKLKKATTTAAFHQLSSWIKFVMFTGILSMIFFQLYL